MLKSPYVLASPAALLIIAAVGFLTWQQFVTTREAWSWVRHTYDVVRTVDTLEIALGDARAGARNYLLSGNDTDIAAYDAARDRVALLQADLIRLTADNQSQQDRLHELAPTVARILDELSRIVELFQKSGSEAAISAVRSGNSETLAQQSRAILNDMLADEDKLLAERRDAAETSERRAREFAIAGAAAALVLLALAAWLLTRARAQLLASEAEHRVLAEQMRTAFDSVSQGIGVFDADWQLVHWNVCFDVLLDLPKSVMRQGTTYETIAAEAEAAAKVPVLESEDQIRHGRRAESSNEPVVFDRTRASDGRTLEIRRTTGPDGGFVLTISDITERVRAERTARETQRLQAVGQLTGGIAHDFNNLLTVIMGNLERLAAKQGADSAGLPMIQRALWATERGASLTQQLLAFARKQPLAPVPVNLSAMLPDVANLLRRTLGEHIEVRVIDAAGLWSAMADPAQLESAILNLALNARDAMPAGGSLTLELANKVIDRDYARRHAELAPGDYVMIAVSDTGTGMPPDVLAQVFEPFFTTKPDGKGTGLGLPMVYGFAKQSGGHINIYSEPGEGTTVRLYLPRATGAPLAAPQRLGAPLELPRGSATVLVVEDEAAVREVTVSILRDLGYRVLEAGNGIEAVRMLSEAGRRVDLLLADVVLPGGIKGQEVARKLAEMQPGLRVLFMSGYSENAIVHQGRLDDGVALLAKPFSREALARKIADVMGVRTAPEMKADNVVHLGSRGAAT